MTVEEFLLRLEGVTKSGEGWVARCPSHGDENASMSVSKGSDGRILIHCFAGCSAESIVAAMGLKMSDLMPPKNVGRPQRSAKRSWGKWVCDYDYQDENGVVVYKASRYIKDDGKKTFVMKHPDPKSKYGWSFGLSKVNMVRVPFRLPRVIEAAKAGKTIVFAEGEKDVLNIEKLGLTATCNIGGAGKWAFKFPEDWGKWFDGAKKILIVADNDPTVDAKGKPFAPGQRHAWDVMRKLHDAGVRAQFKLMVMPQVDGQKHVKDFTDWVEARTAAGLTADKAAFQEAVKNAEPWPVEWQFDDGGIPPAGCSVDGSGEKESEDAAIESCLREMNALYGRFGVEVDPPSPSSTRRFKAEFHVFGDTFETIEVKAENELPLAIATACSKVSAANNGKLLAKMANDINAIVCLMWLRCRGKFYWNEIDKGFATSMYFDETTGVLMHIRHDEFMSFLATASHVNRESTTFKYIMSMIDDAALSDEVAQGVVPSNLWACVGDKIYISSGDSEMYRIDAEGVTKVQNGTDGVVFMRKNTLKPWSLVDGNGLDPFSESLIFKGASFADQHGRMIVRLWFLNLFRNHRMKPPLLITGRFQSGKTRMAAAIKEIVGTSDMSVQEAEDGDKGLDAFWATVNDGILEVYDNLDTKIKWVPNTLQIAATNGQTKRRTLYTTFGVSILRANAHLIVTSNNPMFATELGLSDRMQTVRLGTARKLAVDTALSEDIAEHRDEFMTWTARLLSKALADHEPVETSINMRHPDFSTFGIRLGRAGGFEDEAKAAMMSAELDKSVLPLQNDAIAKEMLYVLVEKNGVWQFNSQDMANAIVQRQRDAGQDDGKTEEIFSCRRIGKTISKYLDQFSKIFKMQKPKTRDGKTLYAFDGAAPGVPNLVGLVDLEGTFDNTPIQNHSMDFSQITPSNPSNPLTNHILKNNEIDDNDNNWEFDL